MISLPFCLHRLLARQLMILRTACTHPMYRRLAARSVKRTTKCYSVDGDNFSHGRFTGGHNRLPITGLKLARINRAAIRTVSGTRQISCPFSRASCTCRAGLTGDQGARLKRQTENNGNQQETPISSQFHFEPQLIVVTIRLRNTCRLGKPDLNAKDPTGYCRSFPGGQVSPFGLDESIN